MGTSTILDVIGSIIIFGVLLLMSLRLNASASEYNNAYNANYLLQRNMIVLTVILEQDLKSVGLNVPLNVPAVLVADTKEFRFMKGADVIDYIVGDSTELASTDNPRDRYLYRNVNGVVNRMNLGVTNLAFIYWRIDDPTIQLATPVAVTGNIGPIDVSITLESPYKLAQADNLSYMQDNSQYIMFWRQIRSIARRTQVQTP
jgi:hypothetical protein